MAKLITKEKFIQAIENNEKGLTNEELAVTLGISLSYFYDLRKKYQNDIHDLAKEMAKRTAATQVSNLMKNAAKGDTRASKILLEMSRTYMPSLKQEHTGQITINYIINAIRVPKNAGISGAVLMKDEANQQGDNDKNDASDENFLVVPGDTDEKIGKTYKTSEQIG